MGPSERARKNNYLHILWHTIGHCSDTGGERTPRGDSNRLAKHILCNWWLDPDLVHFLVHIRMQLTSREHINIEGGDGVLRVRAWSLERSEIGRSVATNPDFSSSLGFGYRSLWPMLGLLDLSNRNANVFKAEIPFRHQDG